MFVDFHIDLFEPFYVPQYERYDIVVEEYWAPPPYFSPPPPLVLPPPLPTLDEAWSLLRSGLLDDANLVFAEVITLAPDSAMAHVGHALTSALRGEYLTAIHDMRLAIVLEPDVLLYLPIDEELVIALEEIRLTFADGVQLVPGDVDALFMVAALHFALGEDHEAYFAIRRAIDFGDYRESSRLLHQAIDSSLAADYGVDDD